MRRRRAASGVAAALGVLVAISIAPAVSAEPNSRQIIRTHRLIAGGITQAAAPIPDRSLHPSRAGAATGTYRIATVDSSPYTGFENAVYAPTKRTVYVAYKRFLRNPYDPGGDVVPAQLRVAKSIDGGATWKIRVVDREAAEQGDLYQQSVSIGGDGGDTVYVAYLVEGGGGGFRVAKSTDGGVTWSRKTISTSEVGTYNAIKVLDANDVLLVGERLYPREALRLFATTNGGAHWVRSTVSPFGWYMGLDTDSTGRLWLSHYHPGDTDLYVDSSPSAAGPWTDTLVDGTNEGTTCPCTGLGSALAVSRNDVYVSYENFDSDGSVVRVAGSTDGGDTWTISGVAPGGWNTSIATRRSATPGQTELFVTYWWVKGSPLRAKTKIAISPDGGATWSIERIPDPLCSTGYIDIAAPRRTLQYVSYQVTTHGCLTPPSALHVARIDRP